MLTEEQLAVYGLTIFVVLLIVSGFTGVRMTWRWIISWVGLFMLQATIVYYYAKSTGLDEFFVGAPLIVLAAMCASAILSVAAWIADERVKTQGAEKQPA